MRAGLFDSVPTNVPSLHAALKALLPDSTMSAPLNPRGSPLCLRGAGRWPFLFGHFGAEYRPILVEAGWSVASTAIQEPISRAVNLYTALRAHSPHTDAYKLRPSSLARELSLSQFIRSPEVRWHISNAQTRFLAGSLGRSPGRTAKELLETFSCVGVWDRLSDFLARLCEKLEVTPRVRAATAVAECPVSASEGELASSDRDYLRALNEFDCALYEESLLRSDSTLQNASARSVRVDDGRADSDHSTYANFENGVPPTLSVEGRVAMTARCRDCDPLPKVEHAGQIFFADDGTPVQIMHNGLRMLAGGYHGGWMARVIKLCRGHHEPQEERAFHEVLRHVPAQAAMLEIGGFWSYYSLWFLLENPLRRALVIEPDPVNLVRQTRN